MRDKFAWLNWFCQFFCSGLSSLSYSYAWFCSLCEGKIFLLHRTYLLKHLWILTYVFYWVYFIQCLTSLSSINHLLYLYAWFWCYFIKQTRFSQSTLLRCLSLKTLPSIIGLDNLFWWNWLTWSTWLQLFYHKWPYSDGYLSYSDPWLWLPQSYSFWFISLFYS